MKNGFYVSAYCSIDEDGCVLKAQIRHDQAIALWKVADSNVELVKYWELERITRQKQHMRSFLDKQHFLYVLENLLCETDVKLDEIITIFGIPEFDTTKDYISIAKEYGLPFHSVAHVFSALIDTEKQFSGHQLVIALDGGPDNLLDNGFDLPYHYAAAIFEQGKLVAMEPVSSPAYIWAEASDKFLIREGTLMALTDACTCQYELGNLDLQINNFMSMWDIPNLRKEFERVWSTIENTALEMDERFSIRENKISCFMKKIQKLSRDMVLKDVSRILSKYELEPKDIALSVVGGFALNCPTNTWLMKKLSFKEFIAPPCVNDSGMALGIGLVAFYNEFREQLKFKLYSPYYGHQESYELFENDYKEFIHRVDDFDIRTFVKDLETEPVCWFEGASEIGPRALGHRSILSSATSIKMKDKLNQIKKREWWRPVAPIILEDVIDDWCTPALSSPFMLHAVDIKENKRCLIPAVLHLNDSARIQTISKENSFYPILDAYYRLTGIPVICNTSLNDKGEPIINTYYELMNFVLRKKIRVIYVEKKRIELLDFELFDEEKTASSQNPFDEYLLLKNELLISKYEGIEVDEDTLDFYINHKSYFPNISITSPELKEQVAKVRRKIHENLSS